MVAVWSSVLAVVVVCLFLFKIPQRVWGFFKVCKAMKTIPGWSTHWFWGNLHQIKSDQATLMKLISYVKENRYKVIKFWMGPLFPVVSVCHCDAVSKVLKLSKDQDLYSYLLPWLGEGLLISEGKKWQRNRHLLTPAFHYEILKSYVPVVNSCLEIFLKKWTAAANDGESVYVFKDIGKLSLDIITHCAFSTETNCQLCEEHPYISTVSDIVHLIDSRFMKILYRNEFIYYLTPEGRRFKQACLEAHNFTESVIRERKKALGLENELNKDSEDVLKRARETRKYLDFLDILLIARDEDGKGLTDLEIRNEADTFMFEGHDTTTSGMSWTLYCLAKHPEHQDKIREEVRNVLMGREWFEYDDLKELKYTQWCIKEAMRLYPPVLRFRRKTTEDTEIVGHVIPRGITITMSVMQIHRHPDTWENPNEYNPLNFHPSKAEGRHPYAYIPFSAGYRNCIGQIFALNEMKIVIASIINRFQVALDEAHEVEIHPRIVLRAKNDIKIILNPMK